MVRIAGSEGGVGFNVGPLRLQLSDVSGETFFDTQAQGPTADIAIFYDATDNYGTGYWVEGLTAHILTFRATSASATSLLMQGRSSKEPGSERWMARNTPLPCRDDLRGADTPVLPFRQGHNGGRKGTRQKRLRSQTRRAVVAGGASWPQRRMALRCIR